MGPSLCWSCRCSGHVCRGPSPVTATRRPSSITEPRHAKSRTGITPHHPVKTLAELQVPSWYRRAPASGPLRPADAGQATPTQIGQHPDTRSDAGSLPLRGHRLVGIPAAQVRGSDLPAPHEGVQLGVASGEGGGAEPAAAYRSRRHGLVAMAGGQDGHQAARPGTSPGISPSTVAWPAAQSRRQYGAHRRPVVEEPPNTSCDRTTETSTTAGLRNSPRRHTGALAAHLVSGAGDSGADLAGPESGADPWWDDGGLRTPHEPKVSGPRLCPAGQARHQGALPR
ncbi:hypothetical protein SGLAU_32100 [Streptomyces glaucescens]|uniref:Uncharacterized protein n=1 Tax=Streptomyces glaucescens TaxID=1907 RepID=A0A089XGD5_STRGA|nr:hypothetical protein SGLAU_32100 [Streptomyces glaucescens]